MLGKIKKSNNKGFTIIEVMIVLAIAGLIILIVLLAVPALQRNSRNAAIKNDASSIAGGISTFESDNDGAVPAVGDFVQSGASLTIGASATSQAEAKVQAGDNIPTPTGAAPTAVIPPGTIDIVAQKTCAGATSGRAFSIWYSIETATAPTALPGNNKCIDT